ncbi:MAG: hypothetical protein BroJett021_28190 [Chloroflexota bacterium]|nr:MAG: hypothetical protein BroJett021_28190 [Chloroflexota bacterium]
MVMNDANESGYGRNFDGTRGDVLQRLEEILATTPASVLATRPVKRALLEATVTELRRLRAENAALHKQFSTGG